METGNPGRPLLTDGRYRAEISVGYPLALGRSQRETEVCVWACFHSESDAREFERRVRALLSNT